MRDTVPITSGQPLNVSPAKENITIHLSRLSYGLSLWHLGGKLSTICSLSASSTLLIGLSCYNNIIVPQLARKCRYRLGCHNQAKSNRDRIINTATDDIPESQMPSYSS